MREGARSFLVWTAGLVFAVAGAGCGGGSGSGGGSGNPPVDAIFIVTDANGAPIVGATVYLVPAGDVDGTPFTAMDVLNGNSEDRDEPLEDQVRLNGPLYPQAVTDGSGEALIQSIPMGDYFWYVTPAPGDTEHLPGGTGCRIARNTASFLGLTTPITLSGQPGASAFHRGTSTCLVCHSSFSMQAQHAHRLGFCRPGQFGILQDASRYPTFQGGWNLFLPAATFNGGTMITCTDYDPTRGTDKFKTFLSGPTGTTYLLAWLWKDTADSKFKITLQNVINPADPGSPRTLEVGLTYGGALLRQINLVKVPGRKGLYPVLQWQSEGSEARYDRTRKVIRDYRLDSFWNAAGNTFTDPPITGNFEANCIACHATGFTRFQDAGTGEWLTEAVDDVSGEYDLDQNGTPDEINMGCEQCHGAGSDHVTWASNPTNAGLQKRFIVNPARLGPSREAMICGRCHDRVTGNWSVMPTEEPLNAAGQMAPVGISRQDWLAQYTSVKGPGAADVWADSLHSKNYHQQYSDLIKSTMHRNDRILVTCTDCHDEHGFGPFRHHLVADPDNSNSLLCLRCHATDIVPHMIDKSGSSMAGPSTKCIECHMTETAQGGAGRYGILDGFPTGQPTDDQITYYENDLASHLWLMPHKNNPGVVGVPPAAKMPIPYSNSCGGPCHFAPSIPLTNGGKEK